MDHTPSQPYSPAEQVYASWRLRREAGHGAETFHEMCAAHPALAADLRALHGPEEKLRGVAREVGLGTLQDERSLREQAVQARQELARLGAVGGRYAIGKEIGRGGMGSVHEARDLLLDRVVACKRIADPAAAARLLPLFRREMRIAARLSHAAVAGIHDAGVDAEGRAYFTMPLIRGRNLSEVYRMVARGEDGWSVVRAVAILLQVSDAMAYVHAQGVVHRDLKPGNIRVGVYGEVHVMDWGIAKLAEDADGRDGAPVQAQAENSGGAGTPPYMSPEQWRAGAAVGPASDVHALGVMLYELLAGRPPYHVRGERSVETAVLLKRMQAGPPGPIHSIARQQPAELCSICEKAMEPDVRRRYANCAALSADLRAFLEGRVVAAHETGTWAETKKWVRRNKALASAVGVASLVSLAGALAFQAKAEEADATRLVALGERDRANEQTLLANSQRELAQRRGRSLAEQAQELRLRSIGLRAQSLLDALKDPSSPWTVAKWTAEASHLVAGGTDEDGARLVGLADVRQRIDQLRHSAMFMPYSDYDQSKDYINHPLQRELAKLRLEQEEVEQAVQSAVGQLDRKIDWQARMLGGKPWPDKQRYERSLASEMDGMSASELSSQSLLYCKPGDRRLYGMEMRGLVYAERAVTVAQPAERLRAELALAWSGWAVGQGEESKSRLEALQTQLSPKEKRAASEELLLLRHELARYSDEARAERETELSAWKELAKTRRKGMKAEISARKAALEQRIADLEARCRERRTWRFLDPAEDTLYTQLQAAEVALATLKDMLPKEDAEHAGRPWDEALRAIAASPRYAQARWPGAGLVPQVGLVPLGEDPRSGLWEFLHEATGKAPVRDAKGNWVIDGDTGLVFVLVPGGKPPRIVVPPGTKYYQDDWMVEFELAPYLLSKYEMTVGQWRRLSGEAFDGGSATDGPAGKAMPSTQPGWNDYANLFQRIPGPIWFPSRLQWEHARRGGTTTLYWTGDTIESLEHMENIKFDETPASLLTVGSLASNPYGFFDILGNLMEMCGDAGAAEDEFDVFEWVDKIPPRPGDGMKLVDAATQRLAVGSAHWTSADGVQGTMELDPLERDGGATVRPVMRVLP